ncbi:SMP-30/gluconolactonase/LRE family protein [Oceaniferula spumae]
MKHLLLSLALTHAAFGDITSIVDSATEVKQLATGMKFTEGPVWIDAEEKVVFSDIPNSMLMQWSEKDGLKPFRKVEHANGNILDDQSRLLTCQHSGRNVVRTEKDGTITVLADKFEGKKFNSPNDLAQHSDGSIWFTDPSYGLGKKPAEIPGKWVFRLDAKTDKVSVIYKDFDMPNGIVFSPDEKVVYIADSGKIGKIRAFKVAGEAIDQAPLFEIDIRCDGMCVDTAGNIYTTAKGGIHVFDKTGKKIGLIEVEEHPANVCFGGKDFDTLFITARKSLYSVKTKMKGAK